METALAAAQAAAQDRGMSMEEGGNSRTGGGGGRERWTCRCGGRKGGQGQEVARQETGDGTAGHAQTQVMAEG